ncbi:MAG: hypothetical protein WDO16_20140 [Bacteroidota bacterium]
MAGLQAAGGGNEASGGFDWQDIISQVTKGAQQKKEQETQDGGGGIADLIKGAFLINNVSIAFTPTGLFF